jgi:hypothetical protein
MNLNLYFNINVLIYKSLLFNEGLGENLDLLLINKHSLKASNG